MRSFISTLICVDASERYSTETALIHRWIDAHRDSLEKMYDARVTKGRSSSQVDVSEKTKTPREGTDGTFQSGQAASPTPASQRLSKKRPTAASTAGAHVTKQVRKSDRVLRERKPPQTRVADVHSDSVGGEKAGQGRTKPS